MRAAGGVILESAMVRVRDPYAEERSLGFGFLGNLILQISRIDLELMRCCEILCV